LNTFVLDASVAVKWVIPSATETLRGHALQLLKRYADGEIDFVVPDIFWAETGNVLWKGVRTLHWPAEFAERTAAEMKDQDFATVSSAALLTDALQIAIFHERSVYDCLYVALAVQYKTEMITADERLANALAARLPVKWLGAFSG
jgi:predicted nucleic acid-binding protein